MVVLANLPDVAGTIETIPLDLIDIREGPDGRYARHRTNADTMPVVILPDAPSGHAAAVLIPLGLDSPDRIEAVLRFWRAGHGIEVPDTRLTPRQRRRIPQALRATDARSHGASYREIAGALRGSARVEKEDDWRSSPLRTEAIELLRLGLTLIDGGYLDLLHHRRRS